MTVTVDASVLPPIGYGVVQDYSVQHIRHANPIGIRYRINQGSGRRPSPADVVLDIDVHTKVYVNLAEG